MVDATLARLPTTYFGRLGPELLLLVLDALLPRDSPPALCDSLLPREPPSFDPLDRLAEDSCLLPADARSVDPLLLPPISRLVKPPCEFKPLTTTGLDVRPAIATPSRTNCCLV